MTDSLDDWKARRVQLATDPRARRERTSRAADRSGGQASDARAGKSVRGRRDEQADAYEGGGEFESRIKRFHSCLRAEVSKRATSTKLRESIPKNAR